MNESTTTLTIDRQGMLNALQFNLDQVTENLQALIILDIRDFRSLNRSFGEQCGNSILSDINKKLKEREGKHFYLGNDEFAIVTPLLKSPAYVLLFVEQILQFFDKPFSWDNHNLKISVNCGVAYNYNAHEDAFKLLYDAELALDEAKESKKAFQMLNINEQEESNRVKWELLNSLQDAMQTNDLSLYYQPKLLIAENEFSCHSAEALIRWENESHGMLMPEITLPLIQHLGSEIDLIRWLVNQSLKKISTDNSVEKSGVSINIPAMMVSTPNLYSIIKEAINFWNVDPSLLTLEITEDTVIKNAESAFEYLSRIRSLGVRISIDDFGTGYSSLSYFKDLPADELKIDQIFIKNLIQSESDKKIVELIIKLAHAFNIKVVAEGVEDKETLETLKLMGCDSVQGFYISKPLPYEEYREWLKSNGFK